MRRTRYLNADRPYRRSAFTLIEVLVVIAIIAILASLTAAGVFQYIETQKQATTEGTIRTVYKALQEQYDAVLAAADKEQVPTGVQNMATANGTVPDPQQKRARVIWKKLRLKQNFPMTYAEAANPWHPVGNGFVTATDLPGKDSYVKALTGHAGGAGEAAACLLLALQQNRSGVSLSADKLASSIGDTDGDGVKEIIDGWGNPLGFYRFPSGDTELDGLKPATLKLRDPLDPEGTLMSATWNNATNYNKAVTGKPVNWFEQLCHTIHSPPGATYNSPASFYMVPVVASAGRDGKLGLNADMSPAVAQDTYDNIYSYRLRVGSRGD